MSRRIINSSSSLQIVFCCSQIKLSKPKSFVVSSSLAWIELIFPALLVLLFGHVGEQVGKVGLAVLASRRHLREHRQGAMRAMAVVMATSTSEYSFECCLPPSVNRCFCRPPSRRSSLTICASTLLLI